MSLIRTSSVIKSGGDGEGVSIEKIKALKPRIKALAMESVSEKKKPSTARTTSRSRNMN